MTPLYTFKARETRSSLLFVAGWTGILLFIGYHVLWVSQQYWVLAIVIPGLLLVYLGLVLALNEVVIWEVDGHLKKTSSPLPFPVRFEPIDTQDIAGFVHTTSVEGLSRYSDIKAKLVSGELRTIHSVGDPLEALEAVEALTRKCRGGELQKLREAHMQRIEELKIGSPGTDHLRATTSYEFMAALSALVSERSGTGATMWETEELDWKIVALCRENEAFLRSVLPTIEPENEDLLFEIYTAIAQEPRRWQDLFVSEVDRIFDHAERSDNMLVSTALGAFAEIDESSGRAARRVIRERVERRLASPQEKIRGAAVRLLAEMSDDDMQRTINVLHDVARNDASWRVRYAAYREIGIVDPGARRTRLRVMDRLRSRLRPVVF